MAHAFRGRSCKVKGGCRRCEVKVQGSCKAVPAVPEEARASAEARPRAAGKAARARAYLHFDAVQVLLCFSEARAQHGDGDGTEIASSTYQRSK